MLCCILQVTKINSQIHILYGRTCFSKDKSNLESFYLCLNRTEDNTRTIHLPTVSPAVRLQLSVLIQLCFCLHPQGPNTGSTSPHQLDLLPPALPSWFTNAASLFILCTYIPLFFLHLSLRLPCFRLYSPLNKSINLTRSLPAFSHKQGRKNQQTSSSCPPTTY